jgi:hypothetical protein
MTPPISDAVAARRAAIEEELRQRLAADRAAEAEGPLARVALLCAACRSMNSADAYFCTNCGVKFNATVVAQPGGAGVRGSRG